MCVTEHFARCKGIRIPESGNFLLVESKIRENFARGIRDQGYGIQKRDQVLRNLTKEWNPESKCHWKSLESSTRKQQSTQWDPESKTVLYSLTWGDSTGLRTASYYFSFIYLLLIRSPHFRSNLKTLLMKFQLEGFSLTVSSFRERSVLDFTLPGTVRSPRLHLYHSQLIKMLAHATKLVHVSTLISNRATSVKVRK